MLRWAMLSAFKVGTSPGTTTLVLNGSNSRVVECPTGAAMQYQVQSLGPPTDFSWMRTSPGWRRKWWSKAPNAMPPTEVAPPSKNTVPFDPAARLTSKPDDTASRRAFSPYADIEGMRGALGLVLAPYGNISPMLYSEIADVENNVHSQCGPFDPQYNTNGEAGYFYDTPLGNGYAKHGIVGQGLAGPTPPTDLQLSRIYGYVPVVNSGAGVPGRYINQPGATWTAAPYVPPNGGGGYGTWGPPLHGPRRSFFARIKNALNLGDALPEGGVAPEDLPPGAGADPSDPSSLALQALNKHQDRMFLLGIVSTGAVALTTAHNLLKDRRKKSTAHSAVTTPMSGARRRKRRR